MVNRTAKTIGALFLTGVLAGVLGFTTSCEDAEAAFDCQAVCSKYKDCFDEDYDVSGCRSRCRSAAENDADIRRKADLCQTCIDGMSCAGAAFSCAGNCAGIVP